LVQAIFGTVFWNDFEDSKRGGDRKRAAIRPN
jgi:hypothetical protein